jgi:hypothetical protein
MKITRSWAMPNKNTFEIKPIKEMIDKYRFGVSVGPFANKNRIATITNDLDPQYDTDHNLDALDFLKAIESDSIDTVLFDPPYSPRQVSECYKSLNQTVNMATTQSSFWANLKIEISRITRSNGIAISCGWNSGGVGLKYGFEIIEILLVPHGSNHYDTIVTVERKAQTRLF